MCYITPLYTANSTTIERSSISTVSTGLSHSLFVSRGYDRVKYSIDWFLESIPLILAGDWLQGPHVYALYESYGIAKHEIEILFIAGFGSSMIFGTIVASLADK